MATKSAVRKVRVTSQQVQAHRTTAKRDNSPKWEGTETWTSDQFTRFFHGAMGYYRLEKSAKDLKPLIINWMAANEYSRDQIQAFKDTKDTRCSGTAGAIAACLLRGMPAVHPGFNNGKNSAEWLKAEIKRIVKDGANDIKEVPEEIVVTVKVPEISIQDRIREQAGQMTEELDYAIDSWITDPEEFDPKAFKMINLLRGKNAKGVHARQIKNFFESNLNELLELASGNADEQLREGYKNVSRKNVKKLIDFHQSIQSACDQIIAEAKIMKKPRAKKVKPAEELVKKLKFRQVDDKLGIVSVPPATIIGSQYVVIYNTKNRKMGMYIAKSSEGLGVKGTSLTNFTDKSFQKTLRKPPEQLKEFKEQNTQKRIEAWFGKIKATETVMNGRFNEDLIILKVMK